MSRTTDLSATELLTLREERCGDLRCHIARLEEELYDLRTALSTAEKDRWLAELTVRYEDYVDACDEENLEAHTYHQWVVHQCRRDRSEKLPQ